MANGLAPRILAMVLVSALLHPEISAQETSADAFPASGNQREIRGKTELRITFSVFNYAEVPLATLKKAEMFAQVILRKAGIDSVWENVEEMNGRPVPYLQLPRAASCFAVRIFRDCGKRDPKFLRSSGYAESGGVFITIFYNNVMAEAEAGELPAAWVLGPVLAHETGHLLLPPGSHSPRGIMKALWCQEDFELARQEGLLFSDEEARVLRAALLARIQGKSRTGN
jgi:hypothetical protein